MAQNLFKFIAVWLVATLMLGTLAFLLTGDAGSLNPTIEAARLANCEGAVGGFSGNQSQECLAQVERTLAGLALDLRSALLFWYALSALAGLLIGLLFVVRVAQRATTAGVPAEFESMRGAWFIHLIAIVGVAIVFAGMAHIGGLFASWGGMLEPALGWGIPVAMLVVWCLAYWLGTRISTPDKMKPSVPGA